MQRVANALDISLRTEYNVKKRSAENQKLSTLGRSRPQQKLKTSEADNNIKMEVRNTVYNMYAASK